MAGPWEKYGKTQSAPWEKYGSSGQAIPLVSQGPEPAIEEMAPGVSLMDRAIVQNFANSPEAANSFMQKKYPQYKVNSDANSGRMTFTDPKNNKSYVLDPQTGAFSKDIVGDIADVAYPVASGLGEGAAVTAGGAAGPAGAIAAGAGAGAASEALRQKLGQALGIPQQVNGEDVAISAGIGGALPAGGEALGAASKYAGKTVIPKIASWASGLPKEDVANFYSKMNRFLVADTKPGVLLDRLKTAQDKISSGVARQSSKVGEELGASLNALEDSGAQVDITPVKDLFKQKIAAAEEAAQKGGNTPKLQSAVDDLKNMFTEHFTTGGEQPSEIADVLSPKAAFQLKQNLAEFANFSADKAASGGYGKLKNPTDKEIKFLGQKGSELLDNGLTTLDPKRSSLNEAYGSARDFQKLVDPAFANEKATEATLRNIGTDSNRVLRQRLDSTLGPEAKTAARLGRDFSTQKYFEKPSLSPLSSFGATSTSRTMHTAGLASAGGALGALGGYNSGGGYAGATVGGMGGAALGAALGSPAMVRAGLMGLRGAQRAGQASAPTLYGSGRSIWDMMQQTAEEKK